MKVQAYFWWGHATWPYRRTCDELCNTVLTFSLPFVGGVSLFLLEKRRFEDGFWTTSSGGPEGLGVYTMLPDDTLVSATIPMSYEAIEAAFGDSKEHPRIWTDDEVAERASGYVVYTNEVDDWGTYHDHMPFER